MIVFAFQPLFDLKFPVPVRPTAFVVWIGQVPQNLGSADHLKGSLPFEVNEDESRAGVHDKVAQGVVHSVSNAYSFFQIEPKTPHLIVKILSFRTVLVTVGRQGLHRVSTSLPRSHSRQTTQRLMSTKRGTPTIGAIDMG